MKRSWLLQRSSSAAWLLALYLILSTELTVFIEAKEDGKNKDQGKDKQQPPISAPPTSLSPSSSPSVAVDVPQPVVVGGAKNDNTPLPTYGTTAVATATQVATSISYTSIPATVVSARPTMPDSNTFVTQQLSDKTCPASLDQQINIDSQATLYYHLVPSDPGDANGILCGRLEVKNNDGGWVGIGWSTNGNMIGGEAIVGLTDTRSVLKYNLNDKVASQVIPMSSARQTLTGTSISGGPDKTTIMTFTKMLIEDGELEIYERGPNAFLYAQGSDGTNLSYHDKGRSVFIKDFLEDIATDSPTFRPTEEPTVKPTPAPVKTPEPTVVVPVPVQSLGPTDIVTRPPGDNGSQPAPIQTLEPTIGTPEPTIEPREPTYEPTNAPLPTTETPTRQPVVVSPADCKDPDITKDQCKESIYCEWILISGRPNYCDFGPPVPPTLPPSSPPSTRPTFKPTADPTLRPSLEPSIKQTPSPTIQPTASPTQLKVEPTQSPIFPSTQSPTSSNAPSPVPTNTPTFNPTKSPSHKPSISATSSPSAKPSATPSLSPSSSSEPSAIPSSSPTVSSKPTLSPSPTYFPTVTQFPTLPEYEYKRPKRVDMRWVPWDNLDRDIQVEVSEALGYNRDSWNNFKTNEVEQLRWSDLSERKKSAASRLGFDKWSWNCWMNNFESFSWKQLYQWELTPYLETLGWNQQRWNGQNGPPISKRYDWDELTSEQQESAMQLCFYKTSYDELNIEEWGFGYPIEKPATRFVKWTNLDPELQATMTTSLGYDEFTWNVPGLNPSELKGWFEMSDSEKKGAEAINCTDSCWDCWQSQYNSYGWQDLLNRGHDEAYSALGWDDESWCGESIAPASSKKSWNELTEQEQLNATQLCLNEFNWDQNTLEVNPGPFPYIMPPLRYQQWSSLTYDQQQIATAALQYKEQTWNDIGTADIEKRLFDDLTDFQKTYAVALGFYKNTWDCFQNHYRAEMWADLSPEIRSALEVLGWNQTSWGITKPTPLLYSNSWDELSAEQQIAATTLCHFDANWPGEKRNLDNSMGGAKDQLIGASNEAWRTSTAIVLAAVLLNSLTHIIVV